MYPAAGVPVERFPCALTILQSQQQLCRDGVVDAVSSVPDRMAAGQVPRRGSDRIARRWNIYRTFRIAIGCSKQYSASRPATH